MTQILSKYQGERAVRLRLFCWDRKHGRLICRRRDSMQVKVPVMCSLVSSNVVILPEGCDGGPR